MNPTEQPKSDAPSEAPEESLTQAPRLEDEDDDHWAYLPFAD